MTRWFPLFKNKSVVNSWTLGQGLRFVIYIIHHIICHAQARTKSPDTNSQSVVSCLFICLSFYLFIYHFFFTQHSMAKGIQNKIALTNNAAFVNRKLQQLEQEVVRFIILKKKKKKKKKKKDIIFMCVHVS